jgi:hypothetical protein
MTGRLRTETVGTAEGIPTNRARVHFRSAEASVVNTAGAFVSFALLRFLSLADARATAGAIALAQLTDI